MIKDLLNPIREDTNLQETNIIKETSYVSNNLCPGLKDMPDLHVQHQIQIALSVACFLNEKLQAH